MNDRCDKDKDDETFVSSLSSRCCYGVELLESDLGINPHKPVHAP